MELQQEVQQETTPKSNFSKLFLAAIVIVFAFGFLFGQSVLVLQKNKKETVPSPVVQAHIPTTQADDSLEFVDEPMQIEEWETTTNKDCGVTISHPKKIDNTGRAFMSEYQEIGIQLEPWKCALIIQGKIPAKIISEPPFPVTMNDIFYKLTAYNTTKPIYSYSIDSFPGANKTKQITKHLIQEYIELPQNLGFGEYKYWRFVEDLRGISPTIMVSDPEEFFNGYAYTFVSTEKPQIVYRLVVKTVREDDFNLKSYPQFQSSVKEVLNKMMRSVVFK